MKSLLPLFCIIASLYQSAAIRSPETPNLKQQLMMELHQLDREVQCDKKTCLCKEGVHEILEGYQEALKVTDDPQSIQSIIYCLKDFLVMVEVADNKITRR